MKSIVVFSKKINQSSDGRPCTPYYLVVYFHGNILFKKGFVKKWFNVTDAALHILGFRFTIGNFKNHQTNSYENKTIKENQKTFQNCIL